MAWIKYISLFPLLYALVKGAVELVEATRDGIPGADKKAAVLAALQDGWVSAQAAFGFATPIAPLLPILSFLIDLVVSIYNAIGYFKKDKPVVTPA